MARFSLLVASLIFLVSGLRSQIIVVTFEGTVDGAPTPVDSVLVMNLTQGGDTMIYFPDDQLVLGTTGIRAAGRVGSAMQGLPNPFAGSTEVVLDAIGGMALLELHDVAGRELVSHAANLAAGTHRFRVNCERPGVHLLTVVQGGVRSALRLMATEGAGVAGLSLMGGSDRGAPKSDRSLFAWTPGDELRYIEYATSGGVLHSAAIDEVPVASATRTFALAAGAVCPDEPSVTDIDGNTYPAVQIGSQCWMAADLKTTRYRDGSTIPNVTDNIAWTSLATGAWCNYDNNPSNDATYGKLYNWYAAANPNICPQGWHVPTDAEWTVLTDHLGGVIAGGKMKATILWNAPNAGATNESGFSGLPSGSCSYADGYFNDLGIRGNWWSATENGPELAWYRYVVYDFSGVNRNFTSKRYGFCLRCVRD